MYVDVDSCGFVSLMQMDTEESASLAAMIRGAGLEERRVFHHGVIEDIYDFARASFVDVHFDVPTPWGTWGTTITNLGMIREEETV